MTVKKGSDLEFTMACYSAGLWLQPVCCMQGQDVCSHLSVRKRGWVGSPLALGHRKESRRAQPGPSAAKADERCAQDCDVLLWCLCSAHRRPASAFCVTFCGATQPSNKMRASQLLLVVIGKGDGVKCPAGAVLCGRYELSRYRTVVCEEGYGHWVGLQCLYPCWSMAWWRSWFAAFYLKHKGVTGWGLGGWQEGMRRAEGCVFVWFGTFCFLKACQLSRMKNLVECLLHLAADYGGAGR